MTEKNNFSSPLGDGLVPHCVVGQCSVETFSSPLGMG